MKAKVMEIDSMKVKLKKKEKGWVTGYSKEKHYSKG